MNVTGTGGAMGGAHGARSMQGRRWAPTALLLILATVALVPGCAKTQKVELQPGKTSCGLLDPTICNNLVAVVGENRAGLRYVRPGVDWKQYSKVYIAPVAFYGTDKTKVSAADQQTLTNYLYQALVQQVGAKVPLANEPGPGVIKVQAGISDVEGATPGLRTVSMVVPQARALATLKYAATGSYAFVGGATGEILIVDSVTGTVLAGAVDQRVGGGSPETAAQWTMGDAQNTMDKWAEITGLRLSQVLAGTWKPTGQ